jgi:hypothetical protein
VHIAEPQAQLRTGRRPTLPTDRAMNRLPHCGKRPDARSRAPAWDDEL